MHKDHRKLFETMRMKYKRKYYLEKLTQCQGSTKKNTPNYERSDLKIQTLFTQNLLRQFVINKNIV